uniref:Glycoside hydrolase family 5 domain-containing protein n=1 Tax=Hyaloperonospora arabidopsidis (strain Emoy2) TaxID=559515 RepID=M4BPA5_HYAAE
MAPRRRSLHFEAHHGSLWLNGQPFVIKGASYFGMESDIGVPHGLWGGPQSTTLADVATLLHSHHFNLIRVPFAVAAVANNIEIDRSKMGNEVAFLEAFPGHKTLRYLDVLDHVVHELERHELLVLLDAHVMQLGSSILNLWYNDSQDCSQKVVEKVWATLATRYAGQWNVLGADLNNEPHGDATWGTNDVTTDWRLAAMKLAGKVLTVCPHWLIFVQGVQTTSCDSGYEMPCFWGENFQAAVLHPLHLSVAKRLVYCPHTYGPAVSWQPYFNADDFPENMPSVWDCHFGYLKQQSDVPLVIGEWGGCRENAKDWAWQNRFVEYLQHIGRHGWSTMCRLAFT